MDAHRYCNPSNLHLLVNVRFLMFRHKQVMLEAYDQQCDEAAKIFAEYQKRLHYYVTQVRDAQRFRFNTADAIDDFHANSEKEAVYSTVKGNKASDDVILIETTRERNIRRACEILAAHMIEKIRNAFPAYEGTGILYNPQLEAAKLGIDFDGEIPDDVKAIATNALRNPPLLLQAVTAYTSRLKTLIHRETEKIDIRADAELLRSFATIIIIIVVINIVSVIVFISILLALSLRILTHITLRLYKMDTFFLIFFHIFILTFLLENTQTIGFLSSLFFSLFETN